MQLTCNANSLVGVSIRARTVLTADTLAEDDKSFSNIGRTKQAVFPDPVLAIATTSLPSNANGILYKDNIFMYLKYINLLFIIYCKK